MRPDTIDERRLAARMNLVNEHMHAVNAHDVDRTMAVLTESADYKFNDEEFGRHESVREFYSDVFEGFPDMRYKVVGRYANDEAIMQEAMMTGTQTNEFCGIPASGRRIQVPVCAIFLFDEHDHITSERIYLDMALFLRQLGVLAPP
ncbi:MAG: hypothetical protein C5B58_09025 [Acidobacteria bacterium]|nr:MAG: hypothetical protein C5B58_09025 [Acidobacteriota bacterium]